MNVKMVVYDDPIDGQRVIDLFGDPADVRKVVREAANTRLPLSQPPYTRPQAPPGAYRLLISDGHVSQAKQALQSAIRS